MRKPLPIEWIFLSYALTECRQAIDQFQKAQELALWREEIQPGIERRENQRVFDALRLGLQRAAAVSRVFWPAPRGVNARRLAEARSRRVRQLVGLPDDAGLHPLGNRAWRDHVEHLDERIDAHIEARAPEFIFSERVMHGSAPLGAMTNTLLGYDPETREIILLGNREDLVAFVRALEELLQQISDALVRLRD